MNNLMIKNENDTMVKDNLFLQHNSLDMENKDNKIKLYNSLQKCDILLKDVVNQVLEIQDVYIEGKELAKRNENNEIMYNEKTGEVLTYKHYRTILFDKDGKTYVTAAYGVYNSLRDILSIFGNPSKDNIIKVKVMKKPLNDGKESLILTLVNE